MVSGSSLSASQAYSSTTVSPWKVRGLGTFLASGGSVVMRVQSNDAPYRGGGARHRASGRHRPADPVPAAGVDGAEELTAAPVLFPRSERTGRVPWPPPGARVTVARTSRSGRPGDAGERGHGSPCQWGAWCQRERG